MGSNPITLTRKEGVKMTKDVSILRGALRLLLLFLVATIADVAIALFAVCW